MVISDDFINDEELLITVATYDCPVHGKTDAVIFITITGKHEHVYCVECWDEHLAAHLPILQEKELD